MDIDEIRRLNIRAIEREFGSAGALANAVGMSYAQYQNTRDGAKEAKTGKRRGMRKETAWRFEDAAKKPRGWLDQVHSPGEKTPDPMMAQLQERMATADETTLKLIHLALLPETDLAQTPLSPSLKGLVGAVKALIKEEMSRGGSNNTNQ